MNQEIFEWLLLLGRWLHIAAAIAWIGNSLFFMWLDRSFENDELWMIHGGGFYQVKKHLLGPTKVPEHLHWFKWESYWTWLSGVFLITLIFYTGNGTFLLDSAVSQISYWGAVGISVSSMLISWLFYDFLWESRLTKEKPIVGHVLTLLWLAGISYFLCHTLSGRAAYLHVGAMLGTWMTANVFLRIIPRQVKMVEAAKRGEAVNQDWGKNAKHRSTHNTYFTLPVVFIMLSNHFPMTYGHTYNWLILLIIGAAGAALREYFMTRVRKPQRAKVFAALGIALLLITIIFSRAGKVNDEVAIQPKGQAQNITPSSEPRVGFRGVVKFIGVEPKRERLQLPMGCGPSGGAVYANDVIINNGRIKNVLIRVTKGLKETNFLEAPQREIVLDQVNCQYEPRVIALRVGQKVDFVNSDSLFHNVRSLTEKNEEFNVSMPQKGDRFTKVFDAPEIFVQTKCSVHPWMSAYIAVMDHPYYSVTNERGEFLISDLPQGNYTVEAVHEVFGKQSKELILNNFQEVEFIFTKE